ncbi:F510_1955 family glycosylhydrolase [Microbacterium sp. TWP3-1-2b2]|uniref:F510_1955 family glycosylhydrolase n=1 Tax=Microbacterium sp. TWP3-1-2b2 TaxID=2804651 RepID=UPI003CFA1386
MNRLLPLTVLAALALVVTGCTSTQTTEPDIAAPRIEHVHGIAEDPRGSDLLVATHNGIFTVTPTGDVSGPIGDNTFDAMGFTISGDTLFASGHPGPDTAAELGAPNLGIIQSDDYGLTWSAVALNGSTDFHVLTAGPDGTLYGIASSDVDLLISTDGGHNWTTGASIAAADLVATDNGLYAAAEEGLLRSDDQGVTFTPVDGAPLLYALDARPDGTLAGVGTDGAFWQQGADQTWQRLETVDGAVQAFAAIGDGRVVLVDDRGIVEITPDDTTVLSPAR